VIILYTLSIVILAPRSRDAPYELSFSADMRISTKNAAFELCAVIDDAILHEHTSVELHILPKDTMATDNAAFRDRSLSDVRRLAHQAIR